MLLPSVGAALEAGPIGREPGALFLCRPLRRRLEIYGSRLQR
jgi:hypothetical protein